MLTRNSTACRTFYGHFHDEAQVPAGTVVDLQPLEHTSDTYLLCDGHGLQIQPLSTYYQAHAPAEPTAG
ncbi:MULTISPECIES: hypothetical protein [Kocuria]|uniref:hypothetical protein n=1 Tax=Kocuria TaxID=57493 RepID=UPI00128F9DB1|nr:hypothetical protein [Kocuria palustris]